MLNFLEMLGPLVVGWTFIIGLVAIPLSLLFFILYLKKRKAIEVVVVKSETKQPIQINGEVHYEIGGSKIIFIKVGDAWESHYQVGSHEAKLDIPASKSVGEAFWLALTYLRVPPEILT